MIISNLLNDKLFKMKKIFSILLLVSMAVTVILPSFSLAANPQPLEGCHINNPTRLGNNCTADCTFDNQKNCGLCCTLNTIYTLTDYTFYIMMAIAIFMIILAGIKFATKGDTPDEIGKARKMIIYAAVGIAVALLARALPSLVTFLLGG